MAIMCIAVSLDIFKQMYKVTFFCGSRNGQHQIASNSMKLNTRQT